MIPIPVNFFSIDADAKLFVNAASLTSNVQINAIDYLVKGLKSQNLWSSFDVIYPFVGGNSTSHSFNLKNPLASANAYQIVWGGTVTHDSNGITGNASTGKGDTKYNVSSHATLNNHHISFYNRTNTAEAKFDMDAFDGTFESSIVCKYNDNNAKININCAATFESVANSDARGFYTGSRAASNAEILYKNGSQILAGTLTSSTRPNGDYFLLCRGDSTLFSSKNLAFASIGTALTAAQTLAFYNVVQAYQTALSRNV